jgi:hypothetical protein
VRDFRIASMPGLSIAIARRVAGARRHRAPVAQFTAHRSPGSLRHSRL